MSALSNLRSAKNDDVIAAALSLRHCSLASYSASFGCFMLYSPSKFSLEFLALSEFCSTFVTELAVTSLVRAPDGVLDDFGVTAFLFV